MKIAVRLTTLVLLVCTAAIGAASAQAAGGEQEQFERFGFESTQAGLSSPQAGVHADFTSTFSLNKDSGEVPFARLRDLTVDLPPGLLGDPNGFPTCSAEQLAVTATFGTATVPGCPIDSQVGITNITVVEPRPPALSLEEPIYLMQPPGGNLVARLGFVAFFFPTYIDIEADPARHYALTARIEGQSAQKSLTFAETTLWGDPASPVHDSERITPQEVFECKGGHSECEPVSRPSGLLPRPYMSNPTHCGEPLSVGFRADSYQTPGQWVEGPLSTIPPLVGCSAVSFEPSFTATPTSSTAGAPTGLDVDLKIPQDETVGGSATAQLKDATVTLPEGMTIAPGAAAGLGSCSVEQVGLGHNEESHCPPSSKIGSARIDVPALEHPIEGAIYQRTPEPGQLFGLWLVADELGAHLKLPGDIALDPNTGLVTVSFLDNPQIPVREITLHFFGGPRAPLSTPPCGTYQTHYELTPWSGGPPVSGNAPMRIDQGCGGGGFRPRLQAGVTNPSAGRFSPFVLSLTRESGEQNVSALDVSLPAGLLAKLAGVPLCGAAQAQSGDCPVASQVGTTAVASGPGSSPLWIPQPGKAPTAVYLSGPYKGAPYSLVVNVPAQAGPFDLGTVVDRVALDVDPYTARIHAVSDPLPTIRDGIPLDVRSIEVKLDRPSFTLNPTSCEAMAIEGSVSTRAGQTAAFNNRFQVGECGRLAFKPKLSVRLSGIAHRGAHPGVNVTVRPRSGDANLREAVVMLPPTELLDTRHVKAVCPAARSSAGSCPKGSLVGRAKVWTPLLSRPLEGEVNLRSSATRLPVLAITLKGEVDATFVARVDSVHRRLRFRLNGIPDVPLDKVALDLFGGKRGMIVDNGGVCSAKARVKASLTAQNGRAASLDPRVQTHCRGA